MKKLIKVELRDLEVYYINCVTSQSFKEYQVIFLHYKRIEENEGGEYINADYFYYNNYEELKNDRGILEDILNKNGQ